MPKQNPFIIFEVTKPYSNFRSLYDDNRREIYFNIVKIFDELTRTHKKSLILSIKSDLGGLNWDTEFKFLKTDYEILSDAILDFFEDNEEYEICNDIIDIIKKLQHKSGTNQEIT